MQRILAIALLTLKAAVRYRLLWLLAAVLAGAVIGLPLLVKDDGTARGFTQILLTYTLTLLTALLGISTLWLSCGTLAREIEERQIQLLAVKPVGRWQIWLGKWVGIMVMNLLLVAFSGACVYALLQYRAGKLSPEQQAILRKEVFVARSSLKEKGTDIEAETDRMLALRLKDVPVAASSVPMVRQQIKEQVRAAEQVVAPNHLRRWKIDLGPRALLLKDEPLFLRIKFHAAQTNSSGTYLGIIEVGAPETPQRQATSRSLAPGTFHEIELPPNLWDSSGVLTIDFQNRNDVSLLFPIDEGLEVLYREGSFALNFTRGLAIILCWLALLAALGLTAGSFLSFPVAVFCSGSLLMVAFSTGNLAAVVNEGTLGSIDHDTGVGTRSLLDVILIPIFRGMLSVLNLVKDFSPIDSLSTGRSITWGELGFAFIQIVLLMGGLVAVTGMLILNRRELATASGNT